MRRVSLREVGAGMGDYLEVWGPAGVQVVSLEGTAVMIGRDPSNQVVLADDPEVSRRHAVVERLPAGWCVRDLTSRNGTAVNGERMLASYALHHRDEITVGGSRIVFCGAAESPTADPTKRAEPPPQLTRREQDVLRAMFPAYSGNVFTEPASTREIAAALYVSEAAVKQHMANLYEKFGIYDGDRRRVRLANEALRRGAISLADIRKPPGAQR